MSNNNEPVNILSVILIAVIVLAILAGLFCCIGLPMMGMLDSSINPIPSPS
jgi:hypothetical protein